VFVDGFGWVMNTQISVAELGWVEGMIGWVMETGPMPMSITAIYKYYYL